MSARADFLDLIREICTESDFKMDLFSSGWVVRLFRADGKSSFIYGYCFDLNGSASQQNATYACLSRAGVACIEHEAFMNPSEALVYNYIPETGSLGEILRYAQKFDFNVVVKPLKGTGGNDVYHSTSAREIEAAVMQVWRKDYGVALSPFVDIVMEIRAVVLKGDIKLMYEKKRICVEGDGTSCLKELVGHAIAGSSKPKTILSAATRWSNQELFNIPNKSQQVPVEWRHNLGHGASPQSCHFDPKVASLALAAAEALNIIFCSVDIVLLTDASYSVLEVNSGVMMDAFLSQGHSEREIAKAIYAEAVRIALE